MPGSKVSGLSFRLLNADEQNTVKTLFNTSIATQPAFDKVKLKDQLEQQDATIDTITFENTQNESILDINPLLLKYKSPASLMALEENLLLYYYQICQTYQKEFGIHQMENLNRYYLQLERAAFLVRQIRFIRCKSAQMVEENEALWKKRVAVLQLEAYRFHFNTGRTTHFIHWLSDLNTWRVYWSWSGNFLRMSIAALPSDFYNIENTAAIAAYKRNYLGYLSWIIYFTRFLVHFLLILKHGIIGPWMSKQEKDALRKEGAWNHIQQQLKVQKLSLLNDLIWGTSNLVCFFWLTRELGPFGNMVTMIFLCTDILLANIAVSDAEVAHRNTIALFESEIARLQNEIDAVKNEPQQASTQEVLCLELKRLQEAQALCRSNYVFQQKTLRADQTSAKLFLSAYALMVIPWAKLGLQTLTATGLGLAGAFIAFVVNVFVNAYKTHLKIEQLQSRRTALLLQCEMLLNASDGTPSDANFIQYQDCMVQVEEKSASIRQQRFVLLEKVAIQSLLPVALFTAFTFTSFGIGIAIIGSAAILSLIAKHLIEKQNPPAPRHSVFSQTAQDALSIPLEKLHVASVLAMG